MHARAFDMSSVLSAGETRRLLDSIDATTIVGLRDRALIALMVHTFARVGATLKMQVDDVRLSDRRFWVRLHEKGGRHHEMPLHHNAERYLVEYMDAAELHDQPATPLFRTKGGTNRIYGFHRMSLAKLAARVTAGNR